MKIIHLLAYNFCSYKELSFDFEDLGLAAILGETGSGKSTILDAVAWGLFGITSKDTAADDVRAWGSDELTQTSIVVETPAGSIRVVRQRGTKNDLHWTETFEGPQIRGKDLTDTQKLLEKRLGVTGELFLTASYLSQFSKADTFFVAKAKDRREVLEKIADQHFAISLGEKASEARKEAKKDRDKLENELAGITGKLEGLREGIETSEKQEMAWEEHRASKIQNLQYRFETFEQDHGKVVSDLITKADDWQKDIDKKINTFRGYVDPSSFDSEIKDIQSRLAGPIEKCPTCGAPCEHKELSSLNNRLHELKALKTKATQDMSMYLQLTGQTNPYLFDLHRHENQTNLHGEQIEALKAEANPHSNRLLEARSSLKALQTKEQATRVACDDKIALAASLGWLYDKSFEMRGILMARVVSQLEAATNRTLERFFDAPIRVKLLLEDSDKLEVEVFNNGHLCGFKSLSGGERTILKLCFSLSLMKAAQDKAGIHFGQIFLDEPLTGLSENLKVKAFALFEQLEQEYETILVIEHSSEFKAQFCNTYTVVKSADGYSEINEP